MDGPDVVRLYELADHLLHKLRVEIPHGTSLATWDEDHYPAELMAFADFIEGHRAWYEETLLGAPR